jgi:hypothetical protein
MSHVVGRRAAWLADIGLVLLISRLFGGRGVWLADIARGWRMWRLFGGRGACLAGCGACLADVALVWRTWRMFCGSYLEVTESVLILNFPTCCVLTFLLPGLNVTAATRQGGNEAEREPLQGLQPAHHPPRHLHRVQGQQLPLQEKEAETFTSDRLQRGQEHRSQAGGMKKR